MQNWNNLNSRSCTHMHISFEKCVHVSSLLIQKLSNLLVGRVVSQEIGTTINAFFKPISVLMALECWLKFLLFDEMNKVFSILLLFITLNCLFDFFKIYIYSVRLMVVYYGKNEFLNIILCVLTTDFNFTRFFIHFHKQHFFTLYHDI